MLKYIHTLQTQSVITSETSVPDYRSICCCMAVLKSRKYKVPYFSIDKAQLIYNAHPKPFRYTFDVYITRITLTSGRVRKYRPLLTEDTGVIPKNVPG
jgi:hypothetical protein